MYKDKEKQASKERQRRYRAWKASGGVTKGVTSEGVTSKALPEPVISKTEQHVGASQIKDVRALHKGIGQQTNVTPLEWPENEVTPKGARLLEEVFGKNLLETGLPDDKPRATDLNVQTIWDRRNAQGQAGGYSANAEPKDYPQTQRPHIKQ